MSILEKLGGFYTKNTNSLDPDHKTNVVARVIAQHRGLLRLRGLRENLDGEWWGELSGRLKHEAQVLDRPVVGDWVLASGESERLRIEFLLPRKTLIKRVSAGTSGDVQLMAANVDRLLIVTSANADFSMSRVDRYWLLAEQSGVKAELLLAKADLCPSAERAKYEAMVPATLPVRWVSSLTSEGLSELKSCINPGETVILMGSSGVGKSSLTNALLKAKSQEVGDIRMADGKGRHTTSTRSLFLLEGGGVLIDTPGLRELSLDTDGSTSLSTVFEDLDQLSMSCQFRDCGHNSEPGCALLLAAEKGEISLSRIKNYKKIQREQAAREKRKQPLESQKVKSKLKAQNQQLRTFYRAKDRS